MAALALPFAAVSADETESSMGTVIGIDLGTTYSCVGVFKNGRVEIIANDQGNRITPSYVAWTADEGERLIGDSAKNQATINPENTVFDVKRLIGRKFADKSVQSDKKLFPFGIVAKGDKPYVEVTLKGEKRQFAPEEVSAMVLVKMTFLHSSSFSASRSPMSKVLLSILSSPREDAYPMLRFESILSQSELMLLALLFNLYDRHIVILSSVSSNISKQIINLNSLFHNSQ